MVNKNLKLEDKIFLLDGPMGTEIDRRGGDISLPLWSARSLIDNPDLILEIHTDYITAGADIITTNTFRTSQWTLQKAGLSDTKAKELTNFAVTIAKEARHKTRHCLIAGSIAPLEDCYSPYLVPAEPILQTEHPKLISDLAESGIDIFLIETMNSFKEAKIAYESTKEYPDIPVIVSFTCDNQGHILSGDSWKNVTNFFKDKVDILSINCSSISGSSQAIKELMDLKVHNWGVYPNFGTLNNQKWTPNKNSDLIHQTIHEWIKLEPKLVGTCCGALPGDTKRIQEYLK